MTEHEPRRLTSTDDLSLKIRPMYMLWSKILCFIFHSRANLDICTYKTIKAKLSSRMSLIHCSPLFHSLEPLPIMSPSVMRSGKQRSNQKLSVSKQQPARPRADTTTGALENKSHLKSRKSAGNSDKELENASFSNSTIKNSLSGNFMQQKLPELSPTYNVLPTDADSQGLLTLTTEVQPMSDLSSSQQKNH